MSKLARTLVLGATLAAIILTGAVAQAQSNDESTRRLLSNHFSGGHHRHRLALGPGDVRSEAPVFEGASRPRWMAVAVETSLI
jgi:hypothetical protein